MKQEINPTFDPWESYLKFSQEEKFKLTNIEFTTTNLCNMRCEHCAVGFTLTSKDPEPLPIDLMFEKLDELPDLTCLSITGGEPMLSKKSVEEYVLPLLKYAHERDIYTQINSNLTQDIERYELIAPYLDVLHISHNWGTVYDFVERGFTNMEKKPSIKQRESYFQRIIENSKTLSRNGVMVSAETMLNPKTLPYIEQIHYQVVHEMNCSRHEIHPMYPSDFAGTLEALSLDEMRIAIEKLLDIRDQNTWMLFGTLPFFPCSDNQEDLKLLTKLYNSKNVTVRNDPDGRSRLNINIFTGDIIVTDFGDIPPLGNIKRGSLIDAFDRWLKTDLASELSCYCPSVKCLGPNVFVKNLYYSNENFGMKVSNL
ncbi:radical SAM/CxCxxxxC motif protein YfkAB [Calidifontibacillus oryziterrae]|uniref:radical SAM/CxCxxxxC motif protein YfkAB n=1 Tax=Calidifontibacillus oryziterrae TaxID=1191699 RepID=UPI00031C6557|nr:radical SAM/CxCxxxxC motif protein YfkAB [Calidifontibacillus oryziterrae]